MVKILFFKINFDKSPPVFRPQETVIGNVEIEVEKKSNFNSLSISLNGIGYTYWEKTSGAGGKIERVVIYSEKEEFLKSNFDLVKKKDNDLFLEAKQMHKYSFNFILPENLPTSFDSINAKIAYNLKATLSVKSKAKDTHTIKSFTLISDYDLSMVKPRVDRPFGVSESKITCCACCASDPIIATFSVNKTGFFAGENIITNIDINIDNQSNREISHAKIKLLQLIKFKGLSTNTIESLVQIKRTHRSVAHLNFHKEIGPKSKMQLVSEHPFIIPPIVPTSNQYSKLIEINYSLVFTFGCANSFDIDLTIPIKIGTRPFKADQEYFLTYQESTFDDPGKLNADDDSINDVVFESDLNTFKPFYPYYKKQ